MTLGGLGCPFTCEAAAFFLTQRRAQEARPGAASARLTAWGAPPFSGLPAWSPSPSPVGAGEDTRVGTAPAVSRRRCEKRRIFCKTGDVETGWREVVGAGGWAVIAPHEAAPQ